MHRRSIGRCKGTPFFTVDHLMHGLAYRVCSTGDKETTLVDNRLIDGGATAQERAALIAENDLLHRLANGDGADWFKRKRRLRAIDKASAKGKQACKSATPYVEPEPVHVDPPKPVDRPSKFTIVNKPKPHGPKVYDRYTRGERAGTIKITTPSGKRY